MNANSESQGLAADERTSRSQHPEPLIIPTVIESKGVDWERGDAKSCPNRCPAKYLSRWLPNSGSRPQCALLDNQGFRGNAMRYLLNPLYEEAITRRTRASGRQRQCRTHVKCGGGKEKQQWCYSRTGFGSGVE